MNRTIAGLLVLLLALSACAAAGGGGSSASPSASGEEGGGGDGGGIEHPTGAAEPVLVVSSAGGFAPIGFDLTQLPMLVILGDGRVIQQGVQTLEFPGPALPPLVERTLTPEGLQEVLRAIDRTNLFAGDLELRGMQAMIADAADTVFEVHAGGRDVRVVVYALDVVGPDMEPPPGIDAAELNAYEALGELNAQLMSLGDALPAEAWESEGWQPYEPDGFRLFVRDVTGEPLDDLEGQVREWPTDDDPATVGEEVAVFGDGTRCVIAEGEDAALWLTELSAANQNTVWTPEGERRFMIQPRPLLPHEAATCPEPAGT